LNQVSNRKLKGDPLKKVCCIVGIFDDPYEFLRTRGDVAGDIVESGGICISREVWCVLRQQYSGTRCGLIMIHGIECE